MEMHTRYQSLFEKLSCSFSGRNNQYVICGTAAGPLLLVIDRASCSEPENHFHKENNLGLLIHFPSGTLVVLSRSQSPHNERSCGTGSCVAEEDPCLLKERSCGTGSCVAEEDPCLLKERSCGTGSCVAEEDPCLLKERSCGTGSCVAEEDPCLLKERSCGTGSCVAEEDPCLLKERSCGTGSCVADWREWQQLLAGEPSVNKPLDIGSAALQPHGKN
ncbi:unnamed protein product [Arctogadus glacialis]